METGLELSERAKAPRRLMRRTAPSKGGGKLQCSSLEQRDTKKPCVLRVLCVLCVPNLFHPGERDDQSIRHSLRRFVAMTEMKVSVDIAGTAFSDFEFEWTWQTSQLLSRATGASIREPLDLPHLSKSSEAPAHPMVPFNGALLARNRDEVMDQLIGGYANWQQVGRWGSGGAKFLAPVGQSGRGRVTSRITEVGGTSKGHALVRFAFEVQEATSGAPLLEGWMLLFLLGCAPEGAGALAARESPSRSVPRTK